MTVHIDIKTIANNLPEQAKRTVLYGIVGSLNARIIGASSRIVQAIERNDSDVSTEVVNGFAKTAEDAMLRAESGTGHNSWHDLLWLSALRDDYREMLALEVNDNEVLPFGDTMKFMTSGEVRAMPKEVLEGLAAALDCGITAEDLARLNSIDQAQQRAALAAKRHDIMQVIQSLPRPGDIGFLYDEDTDMFDRLSHDTQVSVASKLCDSLNKARDNALLAVMRRSRGASLSDIPLINAAIKEVELALKNAEGRLPAKVNEEINQQNEEAHKAHLAELAEAAAPKKQSKRIRVKTGEVALG